MPTLTLRCRVLWHKSCHWIQTSKSPLRADTIQTFWSVMFTFTQWFVQSIYSIPINVQHLWYTITPLSGHVLFIGPIQWRIQDFPEGGAWTLQGGREHAKFSRKLHEIERIWTPRGGRASLTPPPRSANAIDWCHTCVFKSSFQRPKAFEK